MCAIDTKYDFYTDPGHAWLKVRRSELIELSILNDVSAFSYQKNGHVYLEEDLDLSIFMEAKNNVGQQVLFTYINNNYDSPVRSLEHFLIHNEE